MQVLFLCPVSHDSTLVFTLVSVTLCPVPCYDKVGRPHSLWVPGLELHISTNRLTPGSMLTLYQKGVVLIILPFTEINTENGRNSF